MKGHLRIAVTHAMRARMACEISVGLAGTQAFDGYHVVTTYGVRDDSMGGLGGPLLLESGEQDLVFLNPSPITFMALNGLGPYKRKIPISNLAVFPSWDRLTFAVSKRLGMTSIAEIAERRIPIRLSTRGQGDQGSTAFALKKIMHRYGLSFDGIESWGGKVEKVAVPNHPDRAKGIMAGAFDAVFDEGLDTWGANAISNGMTFLPVEDAALGMMADLGFRRTTIPRSMFPALGEDVPAVEFGGWPLCCRKDMPDELAYRVVEAIDRRKEAIPVEADGLDMRSICRDTDAGPLCIPLHPGAERYYRDRGYL